MTVFDIMTELERALDKFVPKKIVRTKDRVPWVTNKLKNQLRNKRSCSRSKRDQVNSAEHPNTPLWLKPQQSCPRCPRWTPSRSWRKVSVNPNKAAGPNKLQPQVLKELADVLVPLVTLIYNAYKIYIKKCLETGRL